MNKFKFRKISEAFIFCPSCKKSLTKKAERLVDCKNCGFHFYWNPSPTTGALLENSKGELLLVERKGEPKKGYWDVPGGFLENNESFEEGLKREIKEELGININSVKYIGSSTDVYPYNGLYYDTVVALFSGKTDGIIKVSDDVASYKFFDSNEIPLEKFAFPNLRKLIEKYIKSS